MADSKISQLPAATPLNGAELVPAVQGGVTVQTTARHIANLAPPAPVASVFGRTGAVAAKAGDYNYGQIAGTPTLAAVATSGAYADLTGKPAGGFVNVLDFGAVGDGVTDDSTAIQTAIDSLASSKGGTVYFPATGAAYLIGAGLMTGSGVRLLGDCVQNFQGTDATLAQWTSFGTWLNITDVTNPGISINGHGSGVQGINIYRVQPIPSGDTWAPTVYPVDIAITGSYFTVSDILFLGSYEGIAIEYTTDSGGGTFCTLTNLWIGSFRTGISFTNVNDTILINNVAHENQFYDTTDAVVTYMEANKIDWNVGYCDNALVSNVQFYQSAISIALANGTCQGVTHSMYNWQLSNIDFNDVRVAVQCAAGTTTQAYWQNVYAQTDPNARFTDTLFQLPSDGVSHKFTNFVAGVVGGALMTLGAGTGGVVDIHSLSVLEYSVFTAGQPCFVVAAGSQLTLVGKNIVKASGAGTYIGGSGAGNVRGDHHQWVPAGLTSAGTTAITGAGTTLGFNNTTIHKTENLQGRISGQWAITTPQAGGTFTLAIQGFPEVSVSGSAATANNNLAVDSGWLDFTSADGALGGLEATFNNGNIVMADNNAITIEWR